MQKRVKFINSIFILAATTFIFSLTAFSQESDIIVVDEVIAQVNENVITLSQIKYEMRNAVESYVSQGKDRKEAEVLVENKKGQMIASMITEELLLQKAKEIGVERSVEFQVNQEFLNRMKQVNLNNLEEFYKLMRQQGVDPEEVRKAWRKKYTIDAVWHHQVDQQVYWKPTDKEVRDYFDKNQSKFFKPATVTISEIFLGFAGRDQNAVREKAKQIVAALRKGEDFAKLAMEHSDRPDVAETKGKFGTIDIPSLDPKFAKAIKNLKVGDVSDPVEIDIGMEIIQIDGRTKAINSSNFDEAMVRRAILNEKLPSARRKYIKNLKDNAYIKIRPSYQGLVLPFLDEPNKRNTATASK